VILAATVLAGGLVLSAATEARAATTAPGSAPSATVLLLRPAHPPPGTAEALVRLRGELIAAGFAVQMADVPASADLRAAVDRAAARARADAVIAILGDPARPSAELRIVDWATGKTIARQVPASDEASRAAEILSIRALELLRAGLLEVALGSGASGSSASGSVTAPVETARRSENARPVGSAGSPDTVRPENTVRLSETRGPGAAAQSTETPQPGQRPAASVGEEPRAESRARAPHSPPSASREPESPAPAQPPVVATRPANAASSDSPPPAPLRSRYAVELGGVVLGSFDGLPPAVLPVLRGTVRLSPHFQARLALAGLGTSAHVQAAGGAAEATLAQSFGLVEVALSVRPGARVQPFLSLGAGAAHLSVDGRASFPYDSKAGGLWAAVADAGLGVRVGLGRRFQLAVEAHAQGAYPYPVVRFLDTTLAEAGRPTVLAGLSLISWL